MDAQTLSFDIAYDSYYKEIRLSKAPNIEILEIGGGAHPSLSERSGMFYTIADPDTEEIEKAPNDIVKINHSIESINSDKKYDLVLSKMVLEHIENPEDFHLKVYEILKPGGKAIHFYACRHSIPSFVNRMFPEYIGNLILKCLGNRDLEDSPKYPAFYKKTKGHNKCQINFFTALQFKVEKFHSFVGHKYLKKIPVLGFIERLYTSMLVWFGLKSLATVALLVLIKEIQD